MNKIVNGLFLALSIFTGNVFSQSLTFQINITQSSDPNFSPFSFQEVLNFQTFDVGQAFQYDNAPAVSSTGYYTSTGSPVTANLQSMSGLTVDPLGYFAVNSNRYGSSLTFGMYSAAIGVNQDGLWQSDSYNRTYQISQPYSFSLNKPITFSDVERVLSSARSIRYYEGAASTLSLNQDGSQSMPGGFQIYYEGTAKFMPQVSAVPEPETYAMLLAGLGIVGFAVRRKKKLSALDSFGGGRALTA